MDLGAQQVAIVGLGGMTVWYLPLCIPTVITIREFFAVAFVKALLKLTCTLMLWAFTLPFLVIHCIVAGAANTRRLLRLQFEDSFDEAVRRMGHPWGRMHGNCMRIQSIYVAGRSQFTLVTFTDRYHTTSWVLRPHPSLSSEQYTALLSVLNVEDHMSALIVLADCSLDINALLLFVHRQRHLTNLTLSSGAISSASLAAEPVRHAHIGRLTTLTAPADYIAHLLPTEDCVVDLTITCSSDGTALARALDTIADLPDSESTLRTLTLDFRTKEPQPQVLPWRAQQTAAAVPLRGVKHLFLHWALVGVEFSTADAQGLPRWLARFPALVLLESYGPDLLTEDGVALAQAIAESRPDSDAELSLQFR
ncbi:hypothetical protein DFH06DRAFT_1400266 [Mycena polygramma]|nr:hypothetical protein DFH06DRAFT_1400266 [Mycena polygramma]